MLTSAYLEIRAILPPISGVASGRMDIAGGVMVTLAISQVRQGMWMKGVHKAWLEQEARRELRRLNRPAECSTLSADHVFRVGAPFFWICFQEKSKNNQLPLFLMSERPVAEYSNHAMLLEK